MTDHTVRVTGLNLTNWKSWDDGARVIAHFDCEANGFAIAAALLIKTARGGFVVQMPKMANHRGMERAVRICDDGLRHAMTEAARVAYITMGGEGGEWTPTAVKAAVAE